ncbi:MAG TPA: MerR family transcriptional regulator [Patescibacteria group bacterium]|nr:MerR family transcriptional regulator [Patescibacteria group bacterium]
MPDTQPRYSLTELAALAGVTPRTVRFYLAQGLLPSPGATGPGVKYGEDHLDRLRLIRRLQREHLPLAEIRTRLAGLDGSEIALLADAVLPADDASMPPVDPADTALDYVRRLLRPASEPPRLLKRMAMAAEAPAPAYSTAPPPEPSPPPVERSQWERVALTPDIELHVRRPLSRPQSRKVDRLVSIARELLEEDPS